MTNNLADRLEAATEGSRELDAEIAVASGQYSADRGRPGNFCKASDPGKSFGGVPPYSTSLDSAMTLVPEGCPWTVEDHCGLLDMKANSSILKNPAGELKRYSAHAETPALALCAAALRAQEQANG